MCTWSHVETFRHAGFKGKATDGAAFKLGRREWVGKTNFIIVNAGLLPITVQLPRDRLLNKAWRGRKDTNKAPASDWTQVAPHSVLWKKTEIAAQRDECVSVSCQQPMDEETLSSAWLQMGTFCNFSEWGPRGRLFKPNSGPQLGRSTVPHDSEKLADKCALFVDLLWSNLTTVLSAQCMQFSLEVLFCHGKNRGFGHKRWYCYIWTEVCADNQEGFFTPMTQVASAA